MAVSVLIVDDAMFMRSMIKDILKDAGDFEIIGEAEDGNEAVEKFRELEPDLITMDIVMPELDGIEATQKIISENPDTKIVMCSALGQEPLIMESLAAGAKDYIVKPFSPEKVIEVINSVLEQ